MKRNKIKIGYAPGFVRKYKNFDQDLKEEIKEKIEMLKNSKNHKFLKVYKLHGNFQGCYSFAVNYKIRIVFEYIKNEAVLLSIGDHDVYKGR